jgi:hypothetical protein
MVSSKLASEKDNGWRKVSGRNLCKFVYKSNEIRISVEENVHTYICVHYIFKMSIIYAAKTWTKVFYEDVNRFNTIYEYID